MGETKQAWIIYVVASMLGVWLHIAMDALNSYGVHPFWPWNNRWFYGDTLFIIEPWLWLIILPVLLFSPRRLTKVIAGTLWLVAFGYVWLSGSVPLPMSVLVTLSSWVTGFLLFRAKPLHRSAIALGASTLVVGFFFGIGRHVRTAVDLRLQDLLSSGAGGRISRSHPCQPILSAGQSHRSNTRQSRIDISQEERSLLPSLGSSTRAHADPLLLQRIFLSSFHLRRLKTCVGWKK